MPVKIRMQRRGRSHHAEFAIVAADSRAPRDGRFIEKLGIYNPNTNPANVTLNFERALYWIQNGAQPTDTARTILSNQGVLMMDHLLRGVKKGAFDENEANRRFEEWKNQKTAKIQKKKDQLKAESKKEKEDRLKAEQTIREKRAQAISDKLAKAAETEKEEEAPIEENNSTEENN